MIRTRTLIRVISAAVLAAGSLSCASSNPNSFRVLTSVKVTPTAADAMNSSNGLVVFTAAGTFSLPPTPSPVTFVAPYNGQFSVDNPSGGTIATVVASGLGTVTVQCTAGAAGTVNVVASALANNGTNTLISGSGQLTCP